MIGPLSYKTAPAEVEEILEPPSDAFKGALERLKLAGVKYLFGKWLIEGSPYVLLFDIGASAHRLDEWKENLWNVSGIPSPSNDKETNDAVIFGYLVAWFLGEVIYYIFNLKAMLLSKENAIFSKN